MNVSVKIEGKVAEGRVSMTAACLWLLCVLVVFWVVMCSTSVFFASTSYRTCCCKVSNRDRDLDQGRGHIILHDISLTDLTQVDNSSYRGVCPLY